MVFLVPANLSQFLCLFEKMWWKEGGVSCAHGLSFCVCSKGCGGKKVVFLVSVFLCLFERMWWKEGGVSCALESVSVSVSVRKDVVVSRVRG